jgi:hypothetical protein
MTRYFERSAQAATFFLLAFTLLVTPLALFGAFLEMG